MVGLRLTSFNILANFCPCARNSLLFDSKSYVRPLLQFDQKRWSRRTKTPPRWWARRWPAISSKGELTAENVDFVRQTVLKQYENVASPLKDGPWERGTWTPRTSRCGLLGIKIGVQPQWLKNGKKVAATLIQVVDNHVIRYTPPDKLSKTAPYSVVRPYWHGKYGLAVVGSLSDDPQMFSKEYNNLFCEAGVPPKRKLTRFLVTPDAAIQPGTPLNVNHFRVGDYVDIEGRTIDHGFQGVVKRWGFKGGPASHGNTKWHRRPGSLSGGDSSRIHKGKKMPGHMGEERRSLRGVKILRINTKYNILYVLAGCIPGPTHGYLRIMDSILAYRKDAILDNPPPMPTWYPEDAQEAPPEDIYDDSVFRFTDDSLQLQAEEN